MKPVQRLRAASPVPRAKTERPHHVLKTIIPDLEPASATPPARRPRRVTLAICAAVGCVALASIAVIAIPRILSPVETKADSMYYETFEDLEAASSVLVRGTVTNENPTIVEGLDMVAYTVAVRAATDGQVGQVEVLMSAVLDGLEPTAETEPLRLNQEYVLALVPHGEEWQLTSPAGQSAFPVEAGAASASLDGSLTLNSAAAEALGLR